MTSRATFDAIYAGRTPLGDRAPWDIGAPQPVIAELDRSGRIRGDVLDAGCGTGENALLLAAHGHRVHGFDISPVAVARAREKAVAQGLEVRFDTADATGIGSWPERFDTVVDCGLFDSCGATLRRRYAGALRHVCRPGATVFLLELDGGSAAVMRERFAAVGLPGTLTSRMPQLRPADVTEAFADGWQVDELTAATMVVYLPGAATPAEVPALFAAVRRR
ncbi:class I SAM-dependent methyltransferase [Jidongwangia harbinensis]|uniref:class I SAM-dependent methyltransferase n=1 Tax=Jidongwangia harbinensis TaxID=2878561 RepID=UPI001CD98FCA|nr:class I SAM-dependent methyltransferase [Jidongwangia harbinensis]MCA2218266.1 class I SAM-dependent methyltransferase [Jidongwangia harbinensis]